MASVQSQPSLQDRAFGFLCFLFVIIALAGFAMAIFVFKNPTGSCLSGALVLAALHFRLKWRIFEHLQDYAGKYGLDENWFKQASRVFSMRSPVAVTRRSGNSDSAHN